VKHPTRPETTSRARSLRSNPTIFERRLWHLLRARLPWAHIRRQVPLGPYFADFACHRAKLVIELDGDGHTDRQAYDEARTQFLETQGYLVMRFWNSAVTENPEGVIEDIRLTLEQRGVAPPAPDN
jgi:very-short-patch-repair endonuclease